MLSLESIFESINFPQGSIKTLDRQLTVFLTNAVTIDETVNLSTTLAVRAS